MQDWINKLTLEVVLSSAFGVDAKIQMGETTEMLQKVKNIFQIIVILQRSAVCHLGMASWVQYCELCMELYQTIFKVSPKISSKAASSRGSRGGKIC